MAIHAKETGITDLFVPLENASECAVVDSINIYPVENIRQLIEHLKGKKRIKKKYIIIPIVTIFIILICLFFWIIILNQPIIIKGTGYYMEHINGIEFPNNVSVIKTKVSSSDVYGTHVLAEEIIETDLSWEEIREIIDESPNGKYIHVFQLFFKKMARLNCWSGMIIL